MSIGQSRINILSVTNDKEKCERLATFLGFTDHQIELATTSAEGVQKAQERCYDLIMVNMRYLNGGDRELYEQIRQFDAETRFLFF